MTYPYSLGGLESPPDFRDIPIEVLTGGVGFVPSSFFVDISNLPVWNQKRLGSCVGQSGGKKKQKAEEIETKTIIPFSPRFVYALAKQIDGMSGEGTYYRLAMQILKKYGCATEKTVPNNCDLTHAEYIDVSKFPSEAYTEALPYAISGYASVPLDEFSLKHAIMESNGVLLGLKVGSEWWSSKEGLYSSDAKDVLPVRVPKEIIGGHAIYIIGFETVDGKTRFHFLNSWGAWADKGTGYFIYDEYLPYLTEAWAFVDLPDDWKTQNLPKKEDFHFNFLQDIKMGETSEEVRNLQIALKIEGTFPPAQLITGNYLSVTKKAVLLFQIKHKVADIKELIHLDGTVVGPKTRLALNLLFS